MPRKIFKFILLAVFLTAAPALAQEEFEVEVTSKVTPKTQYALEISVGNTTYRVESPSHTEREFFEQMPEVEKDQFLATRAKFLSSTAKGLQALKYGFGVGGVAKDRLKFKLSKYKDEVKMARSLQLDPRVSSDFQAATDRAHIDQVEQAEAVVRQTLSERAETAIAAILQGLDRKLWSQSKLFAHTNEIGLMLGVGLQALGGLHGKKGWGGLFDIGISIAYNLETKSLAIQIFRDFERFKSTSMHAVFMAGAIGKAGLYFANKKERNLNYRGTSFYPPLAPAFTSSTPEFFAFGISSGLTWPLSPVAEVMTYTNNLDHKVVLRLSVSPILKGFIRIETGYGLDSFRFIVEPISSMVKSVRHLFVGQSPCGNNFAF